MGCYLTATAKDLNNLKQSLTKGSSPRINSAKNLKKPGNYNESPKINARINGIILHIGYGIAAYHKYGASDYEVNVVLKNGKGGRIDSIINDNIIVDYKNHDMRRWNESEAIRHAKKFGEKLKEYIDCDYTPKDSKAWIIAVAPPGDVEIRATIENILETYGVGIKYCSGAEINDVMDAVDEAVRDS